MSGAGAGAALRGQRRALREGLSELRARRDELSGRIRAEEAERARLQARMAALARRLADTSESLAGLRAARADIDRTIAETEAASGQTPKSNPLTPIVWRKGGNQRQDADPEAYEFMQVLENSQTLLDILKEESGNDVKPVSHKAVH